MIKRENSIFCRVIAALYKCFVIKLIYLCSILIFPFVILKEIVSGEPEKSPLKLLPKLVKRSTSIDVGQTQHMDSSPPSDPWRFFSDIKVKLLLTYLLTLALFKHDWWEKQSSVARTTMQQFVRKPRTIKYIIQEIISVNSKIESWMLIFV